MANQYTVNGGRSRFAIGKLSSQKPMETAIYEIRGWLARLGLQALDVKPGYDRETNVAIVRFRYQGKQYEFRSTAQRDCRLNMWAIEHVIEYKVRAHIMEIEKFETSMSPYLALGVGGAQQEQAWTPPTQRAEADSAAYAVFGIDQYASNEKCREARARYAKAWHPDRYFDAESKKYAEEMASKGNAAWEKIKTERGLQ